MLKTKPSFEFSRLSVPCKGHKHFSISLRLEQVVITTKLHHLGCNCNTLIKTESAWLRYSTSLSSIKLTLLLCLLLHMHRQSTQVLCANWFFSSVLTVICTSRQANVCTFNQVLAKNPKSLLIFLQMWRKSHARWIYSRLYYIDDGLVALAPATCDLTVSVWIFIISKHPVKWALPEITLRAAHALS